ncbi:MAG: putative cupin superfamily protein [Parasphingorhabdus sp.]|jgi:uncharacterized cupin superfamily protein
MNKYPIQNQHSDLIDWPFDNPDSDYIILRGAPKASGRLDYESDDKSCRAGIWKCTEGAFECTEVGDELQTIQQGQLTITRSDGQTVHCGPGDSVFTRKGERVVWDITETVVKVFFTAAMG